jgi:hypothetical protein
LTRDGFRFNLPYGMQKIKYTRNILIPAFLLIVWHPFVRAQQKDFQCWTSAQIGLAATKNLSVHLEEEVRFKENCTQINKQINDLGISIKLNKYIKTSLYYRVMANWKTPDDHEWRQGFFADLAVKYGTGRLTMGYRARFQSDRIELNENEDRLFGKVVNRHKVSVEYNVRNLPLTPFAEGELFFLLQNHQNNMSNYRAWLGLTYAAGKNHKFSIKYGMDREVMTKDPLTSYIIAVNYSVNLRL